jgi:hypothetical protein
MQSNLAPSMRFRALYHVWSLPFYLVGLVRDAVGTDDARATRRLAGFESSMATRRPQAGRSADFLPDKSSRRTARHIRVREHGVFSSIAPFRGDASMQPAKLTLQRVSVCLRVSDDLRNEWLGGTG